MLSNSVGTKFGQDTAGLASYSMLPGAYQVQDMKLGAGIIEGSCTQLAVGSSCLSICVSPCFSLHELIWPYFQHGGWVLRVSVLKQRYRWMLFLLSGLNSETSFGLLAGAVSSSPSFSGRIRGPALSRESVNHIVRGEYGMGYINCCIHLWENTICQRFSDYQEHKLLDSKNY